VSPTCAIIIPTHNRREDLSRTLAVLANLAPQPAEIIVAADGCTDGTVDWLRSSYPRIRVLVHEHAIGSVPSRNELVAAGTCDILISIDDDSYPLATDFVARVADLFAKNPRLAAVSCPQRSDEFPETLDAVDFGAPRFVGSYVNCAAAIRRTVFLELGGYVGRFVHAYEEPDLVLRCVSAGWQVRFEPSLLIRHHFTSVLRNEMRTHQRHARNELWSVLLRCPSPQLFVVAIFRIVRQFGYAWKRGLGWAMREPMWWLAALRGLPQCLRERNPLPWAKYRAWMELVRTPLASAAEWEAKFGSGAP